MLGSLVRGIRPLFEHHMSPLRHHAEIAAQAQQIPRHARIPAESAFDPHRRPVRQEPISIHAVQPGPRESLQKRAVVAAKMAELPGTLATSPPICRSRILRPTSLWTATRPRPWVSQPQAVEDALYSAYGQRQASTIYAPNNEY